MNFFLDLRISPAGRTAGHSCLVTDAIPSFIHLLPWVCLMIIFAEMKAIHIFDISEILALLTIRLIS